MSMVSLTRGGRRTLWSCTLGIWSGCTWATWLIIACMATRRALWGLEQTFAEIARESHDARGNERGEQERCG